MLIDERVSRAKRRKTSSEEGRPGVDQVGAGSVRVPGVTECVCAKSLQLCLTLCTPMDCSPPGSSVHGILQARVLEWGAVSSSRGSSQPRDQTCSSYISCIGRWVLYHWEAQTETKGQNRNLPCGLDQNERWSCRDSVLGSKGP